MIPQEQLEKAREKISWKFLYQVEQDMIINRALISLYENPVIRDHLIFRGGTALNKLFIEPPARYSEDIDFVLVENQPIGFLFDAIRQSLAWLGKPKTLRNKWGIKAMYVFENTDGERSKLKIEVNTLENFKFYDLKQVPFSFHSSWFQGNATIISYGIDELMGTKLRALYQRRKGRDLFDVWYVFSHGMANLENSIKAFHAYNAYNSITITKKMFVENMELKKHHTDFRQDIKPLLPYSVDYNFDTAFRFFMEKIAPFLD